MTVTRFSHVTPAFRTFCGPDAIAALPAELDRIGVSRAVIFCGRSMANRHGGALKRVESALADRLVARFAGVQPHSPLPSIKAGAQLLADVSADGVIAIGGGSAIVTARASSVVLAEQGDVRDMCTRREPGGWLTSPRLIAPKLPQWIVPTTPTTAYGKSGCAIQDPETGDRLALYDPKLRARAIFIDPEFALTAPGEVVRGAALNAFAMSVEGLQSCADDPLAEALLTHALHMLGEWLRRFTKAPNDPEPRIQLMLAAMLCGQGSDHAGGSLSQALSHAAGPRSTTSNGVVEALLLPHTMRFNAPVTARRLDRVAEVLARRKPASTEVALAEVEGVLAAAAVPSRLRDVGVGEDSLPEIVAHALDDWSITQLPRPVGRDELEWLLSAAW